MSEGMMRLDLDEHRYSKQLAYGVLRIVDDAAREATALQNKAKWAEADAVVHRRNESVRELCQNTLEGLEAHINYLMKLHVDLLAVTLPKPIIVEVREGAD